MVKVYNVGKGKNTGTVVISTKHKTNKAAAAAVKRREKQMETIAKRRASGTEMGQTGGVAKPTHVKKPTARKKK